MKIVRRTFRMFIRAERAAIAWACAHAIRAMATIMPPEIIFLGDSITEFWLTDDPPLFWPRRLNQGARGETTREMLARFDRDVIAWRPRAVHIMGGTNDLWFGAPGEKAETSLANLRAMIGAARAHGIRVVLAAPPPIGASAEHMFEHIDLFDALGQGIRQLAQDEELVHVDYAASLLGEDGQLQPRFTTDGVHLTRAGYKAMRRQAEQALRAALA